ncbi:MAG: initiation factor 2B, partial [Halobacteriales archaeon]
GAGAPRALAACARARGAEVAAAAEAGTLLDGERVLTLSRSGTVLAALWAGDPDGVVVAESRPGGEGADVAKALAAELDVTLCPDAAVAQVLAGLPDASSEDRDGGIDVVLVGADAVLADGGVVNKVGTRASALAAAREGVACYAVAARAKVAPGRESGEGNGRYPSLGAADPAGVYDGDAALDVAAPLFDVTPPDLLDGVVTEDGVLGAGEIAAVAAEHRAFADWD